MAFPRGKEPPRSKSGYPKWKIWHPATDPPEGRCRAASDSTGWRSGLPFDDASRRPAARRAWFSRRRTSGTVHQPLPQGCLQLKLAICAYLLSRRTPRPGPLLKVRKRPVRRCEQSLRYPVTSGQMGKCQSAGPGLRRPGSNIGLGEMRNASMPPQPLRQRGA